MAGWFTPESSTPASPCCPSMTPRLITSSTACSATPSELPVLRDALKPHRSTLTPKLWTVLESAKPGDASLLPAAGALALYDPDDAKWDGSGRQGGSGIGDGQFPVYLGPWLEALRPVRGKLTAPLATIFQDKPAPRAYTRWRPTSSPTTPATIPTGLPNFSWLPTRRRI